MPQLAANSAARGPADRVAVLVNPRAGPTAVQSRADALVGRLRQRGFQTDVFSDLDAVTLAANQWHAEGRLRTLVAVGGDGTAAELINRVAEGVPLTLFPGGNSNLLARHFGLRNDPEFICRTVAEGVMVRADAGKANGRLFTLMVGCGFDAEVVRRVHGRRTGHIRHGSYFKPLLAAIASYPYPEIRVHWEEDGAGGEPFAVQVALAINLPRYGGGFRIVPDADGADGLLDVCTFRRGGLWHGLKYAAAIRAGRHRRLADCAVRRARRLRVTAEAEVPYQLDGDPGGFLPLDIEVLPGRLTLLVPGRQVASG